MISDPCLSAYVPLASAFCVYANSQFLCFPHECQTVDLCSEDVALPMMQDARFEKDTLFMIFEEDMRFEDDVDEGLCPPEAPRGGLAPKSRAKPAKQEKSPSELWLDSANVLSLCQRLCLLRLCVLRHAFNSVLVPIAQSFVRVLIQTWSTSPCAASQGHAHMHRRKLASPFWICYMVDKPVCR